MRTLERQWNWYACCHGRKWAQRLHRCLGLSRLFATNFTRTFAFSQTSFVKTGWQGDCYELGHEGENGTLLESYEEREMKTRNIKVIKQSKNEALTGQQSGADEITSRQSSREVVRTVKGWIAELHRRRRDEVESSPFVGKIRVSLFLIVLSLWGLGTQGFGQQLRDAFRSVQQAVVIVRTEQKGLAPFPQQGLVSLNGLGSGVLISKDGKVLTAAHLVQSADKTMVEFSQGELIPASVIGSAFSADLALLQ